MGLLVFVGLQLSRPTFQSLGVSEVWASGIVSGLAGCLYAVFLGVYPLYHNRRSFREVVEQARKSASS